MSKLQFISGPLSWYHFEFEDDQGRNKTIHLFSDIHDFSKLCPKSLKCSNKENQKCLEFDFFLEKLFQKSFRENQYLDFFLESPYRLHQKELLINPNKNYLDLINRRFENCFTTSKKKCKYSPYVRMHYTDVRIPDYRYITIGSFIFEMYLYLIKKLNLFSEGKISKKDLIEVASIFNIIIDIVSNHAKDISLILLTENNFENKIIKFFDPVYNWIKMQNSKVRQQTKNKIDQMLNQLFDLVKVRNNNRIFIVKHQIDQLRKDKIKYKGKDMADIILTYFIEFSNVLSERARQLNYDFWHGGQNFYTNQILNIETKQQAKDLSKELWDQKDQVLNNNILFDLTYLDAYILARMFRSFTQPSSKLTIVYAGNLHIESQKDFFEIFLELQPIHTETNKNEERCLSNPNFTSVFFKNS